MDAVGAEDVRQLVRVEDDCSRTKGKHEPGEFVRQQLRRLEVHVCVQEAGDDVAPRRVDDLDSLVLAQPGDPAVSDRDVGVEPLAREDGKNPAAAHDDVGRLVATGHGKASGEIAGHAEAILP